MFNTTHLTKKVVDVVAVVTVSALILTSFVGIAGAQSVATESTVSPTVSLIARDDYITLGEEVTLEWNSDRSGSCQLFHNGNNAFNLLEKEFSGGIDTVSGQIAVTPESLGDNQYRIVCFGDQDNQDMRTMSEVTVWVSPVVLSRPITLSINDDLASVGEWLTLSWIAPGNTTCNLMSDKVEGVIYTGDSDAEHRVFLDQSYLGTAVFSIECTDPNGNTDSATTSVEVIEEPTLTFTVSTTSIELGDSVDLTWESTNTRTCHVYRGHSGIDLAGNDGARTRNGQVTVTPSKVGENSYRAHCYRIDRPTEFIGENNNDPSARTVVQAQLFVDVTDPNAPVDEVPDTTPTTTPTTTDEVSTTIITESRSSGSRGFRRSVPDVTEPAGEVLGVATSSFALVTAATTTDDAEAEDVAEVAEPVNLCPYISTNLSFGANNDQWEVTKLQLFFSVFMNYEQPVTGHFDSTTLANVNRFQEQYRETVLVPWFEPSFAPYVKPTGYVGPTTRWQINNLLCPESNPYPDSFPVLPVSFD